MEPRERDFYIRLFNRLEKAVSDHYAAFEHDEEDEWDPDVKLWKAHRAIMRDAAKGPDYRPEKRERPEAA